MHSLPQEFLVLCRQLGDAQKRCSATVAAQAKQIEALKAQVLRLRAEVIVRDTRLAMVCEELAQMQAAHPGLPRREAMADSSLAAADLVICQTGCISHDEYWRVQDHCRRTGKPCILVDQPLAVGEAGALASDRPTVALRMARGSRSAGNVQEEGRSKVLDENSR